MAFIKRPSAILYTPIEGDSLESIAERETLAGNPITWQDIALYNWGTSDRDEVENYMRDQMGARFRNSDLRYVFATTDHASGELKIPQRFRKSALATDKVHQVRVRKQASHTQFLECCALPAITFRTNSSFIRPNVAEFLTPLEAMTKRFESAKLMVFGHSDALDNELYNKKLSERRAWSAYAFITNDAEAWEVLYKHKDENWGISVIQEILLDLGHYSGAPSGRLDNDTQHAMRSFLLLDEDAPVANDKAFRLQLFQAYMSGIHDIQISKQRFADPAYMGCGEFNLLDDVDKYSEINRRVTFFVFHPQRLPNLPCKFADIQACQNQFVSTHLRHRPGFSCSFYDTLAKSCLHEQTVPPKEDNRLYIAEVCEVVSTKEGARLQPVVEQREQYINLDNEVDPDQPHPEYGRMICLKVRVAWKNAEQLPLKDYKVHWSVQTKLNENNVIQLEENEEASFDEIGAHVDALTTLTGDDGWTQTVRFFVSQFGGDQFSIFAGLEASQRDVSAGRYTVWRKFWYQTTDMKRIGRGVFRLTPSERSQFEKKYHPVFIRFEHLALQAPVAQHQTFSHREKLLEFADKHFKATSKSPFVAHIHLLDHFHTKTSLWDKVTKKFWRSEETFLAFNPHAPDKPWLLKARYAVGKRKFKDIPLEYITLSQTPSLAYHVEVDFSFVRHTVSGEKPISLLMDIMQSRPYGLGGNQLRRNVFIARGALESPHNTKNETNKSPEGLATLVAHEIGHCLGLLNFPPAGKHQHDAWLNPKDEHCQFISCYMSQSTFTFSTEFHIDIQSNDGCGMYLLRQDFSRNAMKNWQ